ncbi:UPF0389 protein CG9231-like [Macrobrachium nipponense]|uniref:UPF0389 protein CG9231-like n=1 Tax=Macrobrachium nipponense TaxID=159736 RepID=UPI0030C8905D
MMLLRCSSRTLPRLRFGNRLDRRYGPPLLVKGSQCYSTGGDSADSKSVATSSTPQKDHPTVKFGRLTDHKVDNLERYLLVWGGKFKNVSEVPKYVSQDTMERARNKARIKINLMMCAATVVGCLLMVMSGKRAQREGQSLIKINQEWHRKNKEEAEAEKKD